jgi:lysophospholipid acyltransferase (LPLAT)-like uncharacterized protein
MSSDAPDPAPGEDTAYAPSQRAKFYRPSDRGSGSTRRMSRGRRAWYWLLIALTRGLLRLFWWSCRVEKIIGQEHLDTLREAGQPAIICYWHQMQIFCSWFMFEQIKKGMKVGFLISPSVTGEVPAAIAQRYGAHVLRGSSTRSGGQALRDMYQAVVKQGISPVTTADGPKGPLHEFKPGAALLARMTKAPVVPIVYVAERYRNWDSWDEFIVPRPFTRIVIAVGEPMTVPKELGVDQLEPFQRTMEETMARLIEQARASLNGA